MAERFISVEGAPEERGRILAALTGRSVDRLVACKQKALAEGGSAWRDRISRLCRAVERHAPVCHQELCGVIETGRDWSETVSLAFEYELWMEQTRRGDKCTGFIAANAGRPDIGPILGQTNDEEPSAWLGGACDYVVRHVDERGGRVLIYSHPGIPAYMGMNSSGLVVLWQYIDNGERDFEEGVPTTALIREMLTKSTLAEALGYLEGTPRAVPNNFQLGRPGEGAVNVECTPSRFLVRRVEEGVCCHANHITADEELRREDIGITRTSSTSRLRLGALEERLPPERGFVSVREAEEALSGAPVFYERTLAAMVFRPLAGTMRIRFAGEGCDGFRSYSIDR